MTMKNSKQVSQPSQEIYNDETFGKALNLELEKLGLPPSIPWTDSSPTNKSEEEWQVTFRPFARPLKKQPKEKKTQK